MTESTEVPPFRGVFDLMGTEWNLESALNFFYQFLIPQGDMHTAKQRRVRAGLLRWAGTSRNWEERYKDVINFDKATFDRINKQAIEQLLDTSLGDLNQNRYYHGEDAVPKTFTDKTHKQIKDGKEVEISFNYGKNLGKNPSGLETYNKEEYTKYRNELITAKNEVNALKVDRDFTKGATKAAFTRKIKDQNDAIYQIEHMLETIKKPTYDETIKLKEVVNNSPKVQKFYTSYSMNPETDEQKVALGLLIETVHQNLNKEEFKQYEERFGSYEEFKKLIAEREAEYLKITQIPFVISQKLVGITKNEDSTDIPVDIKKLINTELTDKDKKIIRPSLISLLNSIKYPIDIGEEIKLEDKSQVIKYITDTYKTDTQAVVRIVERITTNWFRVNIDPLLNIQSNVTFETVTLSPATKDDLSDKPVRMSRDTIEEFLLDNVVNPDNVYISGNKITGKKKAGTEKGTDLGFTDTTKTKFKMGIKFESQEMDFESGYAKTIGAGSRNVISSEKDIDRKTNTKGTVIINYSGNIDRKVRDKIPGLNADYQWKIIRDTMTNYTMTKKASMEEKVEALIKKNVNRGMLADLEVALELINEIDKIQKETIGDDLIKLHEHSNSYFFKNNQFKFTLSEFRNKIKEDSKIQAGKLTKQLSNVNRNLNKIIEYAEDNEQEIQEAHEILEEDDSEEAADARVKVELERISQQQEIQEGRELTERDKEDEAAGEEGLGVLSQALIEEGKFDEYEDEETGLTIKEIKNVQLLNAIKEVKDNNRRFVSLYENIRILVRGIIRVKKVKESNITTSGFSRLLDEWDELVGYDDRFKDKEGKLRPESAYTIPKLKELLKTINEEKDDEGNFVTPQQDIKDKVREYKLDMEEYWNEMKQSKQFQVPEAGDMVRLVNDLDLRKALSEDLHKDSLFNNAKLGQVTASSRNLELQIDYSKKKLLLKGKIDWVSDAESYIGYRVGGTEQYFPVSNTSGLPDYKAKKIRGKRVTGAGRVQSQGLKGQNFNDLRYEFFKEIKNRMNVLLGAVRQ